MSGVIDLRAFRTALGCFTTGVTVMTAQGAGDALAGMTVNSFASLSLDPPLILWSIARTAYSLPIFESASHFAVNILADDQAALSGHFARQGVADKFAGLTYRAGIAGAPLLHSTAASLECVRHQLIDGGDHIIVIGKVERLEVSGKHPLVFCQGSYATAEPLPLPPEPQDRRDTGSFAEAHLDHLLHGAAHAFRRCLETDTQLNRLSITASRMLVILGDRGGIVGLDELMAATISQEDEARIALSDLTGWGLVTAVTDRVPTFALTGKGEAKLATLKTEALRVEAEALSIFRPTEAQTFKRQLGALARHAEAYQKETQYA